MSGHGESSQHDATFHSTHTLTEQVWYQTVYQGDDAPQLTLRALVTGFVLGGVMSLSNLYVSMKTGWSLGVSITSCILAFAAFSTLQRMFPRFFGKTFGTLENYTAQSVAASAGCASSAGLSSAIPALYMVQGKWMDSWQLAFWITAISLLGVVMAIPMKRQMINVEQLKFPSGIATAETLKSLHASGGEAIGQARSLLYTGVVGLVIGWLRDAWELIPGFIAFPGKILGNPMSSLTLGMEGSLIMIAGGAIMGMKVAASMLLGAILNYGIAAPLLMNLDVIPDAGGLREITSKWSVWPGVAVMVSSSLLSFAFQWRTILRAFSGIGAVLGFGKGQQNDADPLDQIECPNSWFAIGFIVAGTVCVFLQYLFFGIELWMGTLAVLMTFILCLVAARATGETDITPIGALGKITQLMYGVLSPGHTTANLMTANVTAGCASHSADLLVDLKSGYLLGANPRRQFIAQLVGVFAGSLFCVPAYQLIVTPENLGTEAMPAPAAKTWAAVAEAFQKGIGSLNEYAVQGIWVGLAVGAIIVLLEKFVPASKKYLPSPTGLGISFVIPAFNSIAMFLGALIAYFLARTRPDLDRKYTIPVSSGLIAGESLIGVVIAGFTAAGIHLKWW